VSQFGDDFFQIFLPRSLFELEAQTRDFLLESARALDVIGEEGAMVLVNEQKQAGRISTERAGQISAGGEPGDEVGPAEHESVVPMPGEELGDAFVVMVDVRPAS
jgi:hypothetical protein